MTAKLHHLAMFVTPLTKHISDSCRHVASDFKQALVIESAFYQKSPDPGSSPVACLLVFILSFVGHSPVGVYGKCAAGKNRKIGPYVIYRKTTAQEQCCRQDVSKAYEIRVDSSSGTATSYVCQLLLLLWPYSCSTRASQHYGDAGN